MPAMAEQGIATRQGTHAAALQPRDDAPIMRRPSYNAGKERGA